MTERWSTLPNAHRVLQHADDARPAWLWSGDGQRLVWANHSAGLFLAKLKKHGLKLAQTAVPIKGQVARIIRLGSAGRTSLARIQFLAGDKPVSATCATTPLNWENDETALLIVGVDPIAPAILEAADEPPIAEDAIAGKTTQSPHIANWASDIPVSDNVLIPEAPDDAPAGPAIEASDEIRDWQDIDAEADDEASPDAPAIEEASPEEWLSALAGDEPKDKAEPESAEQIDAPHPTEGSHPRRLSDLVDRLAADEALYRPLGESDDIAPVANFSDETAEETEPPAKEESAAIPAMLFKVTGRGFIADEAVEKGADAALVDQPSGSDDAVSEFQEALGNIPDDDLQDNQVVARVSRYNFDELSRILTDRVGDAGQQGSGLQPLAGNVETTQQMAPGRGRTADLINLGGETLVLNRLPLGILVFRDQQILFANRAITEMVGYDSVENLRHAGLAAVFPAMGPDEPEAGPVNHLVQRDGVLVPVTARLQSVSWQGRPALMLSASTTEVRTGHEDAVRAFAESFADIRGDGFFEANRSGVVSAANSVAASLLAGGALLSGTALSALVGDDDAVVLRAFLEKPARFAETARPCLPLRSSDGKSDILLFALGQAGVVQGYFGFVRARETTPARMQTPADIDPALLARISRGVRRPLNTIVGFADLISSEAFGALANERYEGYAEDIARAGQEIAALVDELDDYARLRDGRYLPQRASIDLTSLLESCVLRIRNQANAQRVIVRNAISETLPRVTGDRASLSQAVLNLLASAIDQTATGGAVVISAKRMDDGGIAIHVRDSSSHAVDMAERFVVFRDGTNRDGQALAPVRSSVGLALTRSLLAVNTVSLSIDPAGHEGMLFTMRIPADLVDMSDAQPQS